MISAKALASLLILLSVIVIGTVGFRAIEKGQARSWTDSLYFTIVTITTVGYGDIHPETEAGRLFAIPIIVVGVSSALSTLSFLFSSVLEESLRQAVSGLGRYKELKDHVILCGAGPLADVIAGELKLNKVPFTRVLREPLQGEDYAIVGDPSQEDVLITAGISRAVSLVTVLDDADNAFVILEAKRLNPQIRAITVASDSTNQARLTEVGADLVVVPDLLSARLLALSSQSHLSLGFFDRELSSGLLTLAEISILSDGPLAGRSIEDLDISKRFGVSIVAVSQENQLNPYPDPSQPLKAGSQIVVLGEREKIQRLKRWASGTRGEMPAVSGVRSSPRERAAMEVRDRVPRIATNIFLILTVMTAKVLISPVFSSAGLTVHLQSVFVLALDIVIWASVGYLVFSIFRDLRALTDLGVLSSGRVFGPVEGSRRQRIVRDSLLLLLVVSLGAVVSPIMGRMGGVARILAIFIPWICLAFLILILYDVGSFLYSILNRGARFLVDRYLQRLEEGA